MINDPITLHLDYELRRNMGLRIISSCKRTIETLCRENDLATFDVGAMIRIQLAWDCIINLEAIVSERRLVPDSEWNMLLSTLSTNMWAEPLATLHKVAMDRLLIDVPQWN